MGSAINNAADKVVEVRPSDWVPFQCTACGECCRHIKDSVMLEPLDVYVLGNHLRAAGADVFCPDDILEQYCDLTIIPGGLPVYVMKTKGEDASCVMLEEGRCSVYVGRPRVCRMYPFGATAGTRGRDFSYYLATDKLHHFGNGRVLVKDWLYANFTKEAKAFFKEENERIPAIGLALQNLSELDYKQKLMPLLHYRYSNYEFDKPFLPQYQKNMDLLLSALQAEGGAP